MLPQELAPGLVQEGTVGLEVVLTADMGRAVALLQLHNPTEEGQAQQGGLSPLPGKDNLLVVLALEILADKGLQNFVGDAPAVFRGEQDLLGEIIAVGAVEVAERPRGLHHHVHTPHGLAPPETGLECLGLSSHNYLLAPPCLWTCRVIVIGLSSRIFLTDGLINAKNSSLSVNRLSSECFPENDFSWAIER